MQAKTHEALRVICFFFSVIFSIALVRRLRELHHLFVANLALFDLGNMGMFCFMLYGAIFGGEFLATHRVICELSAILCMMSCFGSLWTMMFVAINRFILFNLNSLFVFLIQTFGIGKHVNTEVKIQK